MSAKERLRAALADEKLAPYVPGSTEPWAASVVCAFAWSIGARDVLELGAFEGLTTVALAKALPKAAISAVEHDEARANVTRKRCATHGVENVAVLQVDAIKLLRARADVSKEPMFDFAFVDDDHTYAHVAEELDLLKRVVRPGGLIVMHDVLGDFGLDQLVHHHGGRIIELPLLHAAGGLGVIRV